jgi:PleD family two-component response regulator
LLSFQAKRERESGEEEMKERKQARILVIDHDESARNSLTAVLKENGYVADVAENGK